MRYGRSSAAKKQIEPLILRSLNGSELAEAAMLNRSKNSLADRARIVFVQKAVGSRAPFLLRHREFACRDMKAVQVLLDVAREARADSEDGGAFGELKARRKHRESAVRAVTCIILGRKAHACMTAVLQRLL